ncbi:glycosyl hydrolase [Schizophyllum amplum]|uniref:Glycosyl hydrolase n=1 Tax=Schizophyllum amplum TaxID=97359 RepID=A0A550BWM8_9AGAR|nr:glycosyl hydrolase [Auriculariopsis ampla]
MRLLALLAAACLAQARKNKYIVPGATWYDTDGAVLSAHAGGIVHDNGTWYWFDTNLFSGLNVYSSSDLLNWKNEGRALSPLNGTDIDASRVVERPKAIFSEELHEWVLWFHSDNSSYALLQQGVATSPNITGPYTFRRVFSPLGGTSQDFGLFQDVDGTGYALYSNGDADSAHDNIIARMNAKPHRHFDLEAPTIIYTGAHYYILMSHKSGYRSNNVVVFSAESITGPWSIQSFIAPLGTRTFNSQSTMGITINGSVTTTYLYCGDQWATANTLYDSRYMWLPATIDENTASFTIDWHDLYSIDATTGEVSYPEGTVYEAEDGVLSGSAYITTCSMPTRQLRSPVSVAPGTHSGCRFTTTILMVYSPRPYDVHNQPRHSFRG